MPRSPRRFVLRAISGTADMSPGAARELKAILVAAREAGVPHGSCPIDEQAREVDAEAAGQRQARRQGLADQDREVRRDRTGTGTDTGTG